MSYQVRFISREELSVPIEWAAQEGWNPGLYDQDAFFATDPQGFFVGFLDGNPISSLSAVAYDKTFGFLGFYIVQPEFRGQGYGWKLWQEALKHLPTQNIGLDGVLDQQENYKKSGFTLAYRNIRFEGRGTSGKVEAENVVALSSLPFRQLSAYDQQVFPVARDAFLKKWIDQPESLAIGFVKNNELYGYGMVRRCRMGYKVGPLFANHQAIAEHLFQVMRSYVGQDQAIYLDVPEVNERATQLAETHQMRSIFETARMYTKAAPDVPLEKVFGVTTFELG